MKNKILFAFIFIFLISLSSALTDYGYFKKGTDVYIVQSCPDATYINLSSIAYPNSTIAVSNVEMTSSGNGEFYYVFNKTNNIGRYDVRGTSDGCSNNFVTYFEVTSNGKAPADGIIVVVYTLLFILIIGFGIVFFIKSLGHTFNLEMDIMDASILVSTYLGLWVFYYVSFEYLGNEVINNLLEIVLDVGAVTHVFLPIIGFMTSFIMTNLKAKQKAKITY